MIRFSCPMCRVILEAPENKQALKIACPRCGQRLQIPAPPRTRTVLGELLVPRDSPPPQMTRAPSAVQRIPQSANLPADADIDELARAQPIRTSEPTCPYCKAFLSFDPNSAGPLRCSYCYKPVTNPDAALSPSRFETRSRWSPRAKLVLFVSAFAIAFSAVCMLVARSGGPNKEDQQTIAPASADPTATKIPGVNRSTNAHSTPVVGKPEEAAPSSNQRAGSAKPPTARDKEDPAMTVLIKYLKGNLHDPTDMEIIELTAVDITPIQPVKMKPEKPRNAQEAADQALQEAMEKIGKGFFQADQPFAFTIAQVKLRARNSVGARSVRKCWLFIAGEDVGSVAPFWWQFNGDSASTQGPIRYIVGHAELDTWTEWGLETVGR